jgi:hypothetical protein
MNLAVYVSQKTQGGTDVAKEKLDDKFLTALSHDEAALVWQVSLSCCEEETTGDPLESASLRKSMSSNYPRILEIPSTSPCKKKKEPRYGKIHQFTVRCQR